MSHAWMPLAIDDYLADTRHLTTLEHGAYLLLIMRYWQKAGLPNDDRMVQRIAGLNDEQWAESRDVIASFFDAGWGHPRIDAELEKAADIINKRRSAANRRHNGTKHDANAEHMHSTCSDTRVPPKPSTNISDADASDANASVAALVVSDGWPADFKAQFWDAYPHRVGKTDALAKLDRIRKSKRVTFDKLMSGLDAYIRSKPPDRQWCNPATWLNQGRWDDEPSTDIQRNAGQHELLGAFDRLAEHAQRMEDAGPPPGRWGT
ncbi:DUF1376 domain-containing protein [Xanthobacter autotrophicus]|uniref:YdaU family protein n=1 Tax=Xanthobacter autotrophicus TaxID=280 RepID=UPI00372AB839